MKITITTIFIIAAFAGKLEAQVATNTERNDSTNIYYQAFKVFCERKTDKTDSLLVESNNLTTRSLPKECAGQTIRTVDIAELRDILKKSQPVQLIRIVPLRKGEEGFFVNILVFNVSVKKRHLEFTNRGGASVVYDYDNTTDSFRFKEMR